MENIPEFLILPFSLTAFILFWLALVWFIAKIAGWPQIAEKYPPRQPWNETCWRMQSAQLGSWANYNGILKICADAEGIHISAFFAFALSHPPFSVPWVEINGRKQKRFLMHDVELTFQRVPTIPIRINLALANRLVKASGGVWQYEGI